MLDEINTQRVRHIPVYPRQITSPESLSTARSPGPRVKRSGALGVHTDPVRSAQWREHCTLYWAASLCDSIVMSIPRCDILASPGSPLRDELVMGWTARRLEGGLGSAVQFYDLKIDLDSNHAIGYCIDHIINVSSAVMPLSSV